MHRAEGLPAEPASLRLHGRSITAGPGGRGADRSGRVVIAAGGFTVVSFVRRQGTPVRLPGSVSAIRAVTVRSPWLRRLEAVG